MSTKDNNSTRGTFSLELVKVPVRNHGEKGDRRKTNGGAGKSNSSQNKYQIYQRFFSISFPEVSPLLFFVGYEVM